ncbi:MAG: inorganic pyrophosphatase [Patescibacteria group bacterium]
MSTSLAICRGYLGKEIKIKIDRPIGSVHPRFDEIKYTSNCGYLEGVKAPDGDDLDAYLLNVGEPVSDYQGVVVAIVHRISDDDDKLVVVPKGQSISDEEIEKQVEFQEKWSKSGHVIIRK